MKIRIESETPAVPDDPGAGIAGVTKVFIDDVQVKTVTSVVFSHRAGGIPQLNIGHFLDIPEFIFIENKKEVE